MAERAKQVANWLSDARYLSLGTFRRNGAQVSTPVWFAQGAADADGLGRSLYVFSAGDAGKVKRLRLSARSRIAPCDVRGALRGEWQETRTVLINAPDDIAMALQLLRRKYGWQMHLLDLGARLTGRFARRQYLRIDV